jgi:glyoxalase family protein
MTILPPPITGWHHFTGATASAQKCVDFYRGKLLMRMVKVTVNYDDPTSYHLYFADEAGTPGTVMTFFVWPGAHRGQQGVGHAAPVGLNVIGSLADWQTLTAGQISTSIAGEEVLKLTDPDGLPIELFSISPGQPKFVSLRSVALPGRRAAESAQLATTLLGMPKSTESDHHIRLTFPNQPHQHLDILLSTTPPMGRMGAGTLHHVALATPPDYHLQWENTLTGLRIPFGGIYDRTYFRSIYFREPGAVLYEIASTTPGFTVDEPVDSLGTKLVLPAHLEPRRKELESVLPPFPR